MEWLTCIRKSIDYMEEHLLEDISAQDVAAQVYVSPFFLQRGFSVITGYGISEYIRDRRLYLAALELTSTDEKVIDIALRYGYETPESFTKAFTRFHGSSPVQVRSGHGAVKSFLPLAVNITISGGAQMEYKITKITGFKVIGFQREFSFENAYEEIPKFWGEIAGKYMQPFFEGKAPENEIQQAVVDNRIGEFGINIDDIGGGRFRYLIAGRYTGGNIPDGMTVHEFPDGEWAQFDCYGPNAATLQELNTKIFKEWLPGNPDFELSGYASAEWYDSHGKITDEDYHSAIWLPVKRK